MIYHTGIACKTADGTHLSIVPLYVIYHIVQTAKENNASIIALSALMTTTMQEMKHVIEHAREAGVTSKIMIGGAVITNDYAEEIGADGYSKDASDAVKVAMKLTGIAEE